MECNVTGFNLPENVQNVIREIEPTNSIKQTVLVSILTSDEFKTYFKQQSGIEITKDYVFEKGAINTLTKYLKEYYIAKESNISNTATQEQGRITKGFKNEQALIVAQTYTAGLIVDAYYNEKLKPQNQRRKASDILRDLVIGITDTFYNSYVLPVAERKQDTESGKRYIETLNEYNEVKSQRKNNINEINKLNSEKNQLSSKKNKTEEDKQRIKDINSLFDGHKASAKNLINRLNILANSLFADAINLCSDEKDVRVYNFANLVRLVRESPNEWFDSVFKSKLLSDIVKEFNPLLGNIKTSDEILNDNETEEYSQESYELDNGALQTGWDREIKNAMKAVDSKIRMYLSNLYELSDNTMTGDGRYHYDTNNELGVPLKADANILMGYLMLHASFYSIEAFIDSVRQLSNISGLHSLVKMANDMENNLEFANECYSQLNKPSIKKCIVNIVDGGLRFTRSNNNIDALIQKTWDIVNVYKLIYESSLDQDLTDNVEKSKRLLETLLKQDVNSKAYNKTVQQLVKSIKDIIKHQLPVFTEEEIDKAIFNKLKSPSENLSEIVTILSRYVDVAQSTANTLINNQNNFKKEFYDYMEERKLSALIGQKFEGEIPRSITNTENYNQIYKIGREIVEFVLRNNISKMNLNSTNAKGNMSADVIANSHITHLLSKIQDSFRNENKELAYRQLNQLKDIIKDDVFYRYSDIFFGIPGIKEGLFIRNGNDVSVNPRANEVFDLYLFDGVLDRANDSSALYSNMYEGDYFMCLLSMYANENRINRDIESTNIGGFMLRVPSDAGKNFVAMGQKVYIDGLISLDRNSINSYLSFVARELEAELRKDEDVKFISYTEDNKFDQAPSSNKITSEQLYELITEGKINDSQILPEGMVAEKIGNRYGTRLYWETNYGRVEIVVTLNKVGKKYNNLRVAKIVSNVVNAENTPFLPDKLFQDLQKNFIEEGRKSGKIKEVFNPNHDLVKAFKHNILGELNLLVSQIHMLFEEKEIGKGKNKRKAYVLKTDTTGLFDFMHYQDGKQKGKPDKLLDNNGELIGNAFNFFKLFEVGGFNANEAIKKVVSLYGGANSNALFIKDKTHGLILNTNHPILGIARKDAYNRFEFIETKEVLDALDNIVIQWLQNFIYEIDTTTSKYDSFNDGRYKQDLIRECMLNYALTYMTFDDILEGSSKYYKDAQTLLKRAKEVQMAGTAYSNVDLMDQKNGEIKDIMFRGNPIEFNVAGKTFRAQTGFKAVTVYNTVAASEMADSIEEDTFNSCKARGLSDKVARKIAKSIANPFRSNTKYNDAQSYITLDEFVRRRHADGTLYQYKELLEQLYDDSIPVEEIDVEQAIGRIQVQKNVYYDIQFDEVSGLHYPRQIKNAEFVLIPKFLKEGSPLRNLHDIMVKNGLGQLNTIETSKAANKTVLTYFDIKDGSVSEEAKNKFAEQVEKGLGVETYYYKYLYKQQEVPQHIEDAENKVGIQFVKKIIDNSNHASETVKNAVNELMDQYSYNIQESYYEFLDAMGWKVENGKIVNKDGSKQLDFKEYYNKLAAEAQRLGMDSNFMDYIIPTSSGSPAMPNFMNLISTKFENIIQSLFNNYITRQTILGWHAAQITNVGYDKKLQYHPEVYFKNGTHKNPISKEEYNKLSEEEKKGYYKAAYGEIMIPRWSKNIPKNMTIEELEEAGLDIQLGYRVPTEGKQSITILKVVGFLDDSQGSTIMVPDDWVTQTGADFDVDSIYGICPHFRFNKKTRKFELIEYDPDTSEEATRKRYINLIRRKIQVDYEGITDESFKDRVKQYKSQFESESPTAGVKEEIQSLMDRTSELLETYPETITKAIKDFTFRRKGRPLFETNETLIEYIEKKLLPLVQKNELIKNNLNEHLEILKSINNLITFTTSESVKDYYKQKYEGVRQELIQEAQEKYFNRIQEAAEDLGFISYEEFAKLPISLQNSRKARDNKIFESFLKILEDITSREENYSRSNFDDILDAKRFTEELIGENKIKRSAYNPLDQIQFYVNAMATRELKARSVIRDNFLSLCNKMEMIIDDNYSIDVKYNLENEYKDEDDNVRRMYDEEIIEECYGENIINKENNILTIRHNKFGWSKTDRNITGKLLTAYSSQTTAHILDAIKEGSLKNENTYTFGVFKTLIDLGIDYFTALSFLSQNGISEIVKANAETSSVIQSISAYPVNMAIKQILRKAGFEISTYAKNKDIVKFISNSLEFKDKFREIYGFDLEDNVNEKGEIDLYNLPIVFDQNILIQNLKKPNWCVDIVVALQFGKLLKFTNNINNSLEELTKVSNPDKFGAKQSIYETKLIKEKIEKLRNSTLLKDVNGVTFINKLYPLDDNGEIDVEKSAYKYLAAFLKYATLPSVEINSQVFKLEQQRFIDINEYVSLAIGRELTNEQHKKLNKYIVNYAFNNVPFLQLPLTIDERGFVGIDISRVTETNTYNDIINKERFRIQGFNVDNNYINIGNVNKPTQEEINDFNKLSPVEKVIFIQQNFKSAGIFNTLFIETIEGKDNTIKGKSSLIKYVDGSQNQETLYKLFRESFSNKNPLIRLATIDLIKYAFVVEGYEFRKGNVSKLIVNSAMLNRIEDGGLNLIQTVEEIFDVLSTASLENDIFINRFIRANSDLVKKVKIEKPAKKNKKDKAEDFKPNAGNKLNDLIGEGKNNDYFAIAFNEENTELLRALRVLDNEDNPTTLEYINLTRYTGRAKGYKTTLYRIYYKNGIYAFVPLNKLEQFESSDYSINDYNNIYAKEEYYYKIFNEFAEQSEVKAQTKNIPNLQSEIPSKGIKNEADILFNIYGLETLLTTDNINLRGGATKLVNAIIDYVNSPVEGRPAYKLILLNNEKFAKLNIPKDCRQIVKTNKRSKTITTDITINKIKYGDKRGKLIYKLLKETYIRDIQLNDELFTKPKFEDGTYVDIKSGLYKLLTSFSQYAAAEQEAIKEAINLLKVADKMQPKNLTFYRIEETKIEPENKGKRFSTIELALDEDVYIEENEIAKAKKLALGMHADIQVRATKNDLDAQRYVESMIHQNIKPKIDVSLEEGLTDIYKASVKYYESLAKRLLGEIEQFRTQDGSIYDISDINLYNYLIESNNEEDLNKLIRLILDCKTFGNGLDLIYSLNIKGENEEISKSIQRLIKIINDVKNNTKINYANDTLFNKYFASKQSTNPLVKLGIVKLTDVFDDTSWFNLNIGDIADLPHKQVQNIVSYVYNKLDVAKLSINEHINAFIKRYDELLNMEGEFREDVVINENGKLGVTYTEEFFEKKQEFTDKLNEYRVRYGELSVEYQRLRLEKLKWYAKNVEQEFIKDYYDEINENLEYILNLAPDIYLEYLRLNRRITELKKDYTRLTKEQRLELIRLNKQIKLLCDPLTVKFEDETVFDEEHGFKFIEKDTDADKLYANKLALQEFRYKQKEINKKYFEQIEDIDFKETLEKNLEIIKKYDKKYPNDRLFEKLEHEEYREAYDWIQFNTYYRVSDETSLAIRKAFRTLSATDGTLPNRQSLTANKEINQIIEKAEKERPGQIKDEYGIFHPENLTADEIKQIKEITERIYIGKKKASAEGLENEVSAVLIKSTPKHQPVYKRSVYDIFKKHSRTREENIRQAEIVAEINDIIKNAVDHITGNISTKLLFENCTEEQLHTLASLYEELKEIYEDDAKGHDVSYATRTRAHRYKTTGLFIATKPNMETYNEEKAYYLTHLQSTALGALWRSIFTEDGNLEHPNLDMFGYFFVTKASGSVVTREESKVLVDEEKTAAKEFIEENIEYVETEAYEIEWRRAVAEGRFNEWFEANHYYDPFNHKISPLKIWTELRIKESSALAKGTRVAVDQNLNKTVKDEAFLNPNYNRGITTYKNDTGEYNNGITYSPKELAIINFLREQLEKYAVTQHTKDFIAKGYMPRRRRAPETDAKWLAKQVLGSVGLQADYQERDWYDDLSYTRDKEIDLDMAHLLKGQGYQELEKLPVHDDFYEVGSPEWKAVEEEIKAVKERNNKIRENNLKIDRDLRDNNIKNIMTDYIQKSIILAAKNESKNAIYLMQEDLRNRQAYLKSRYTNNLVENKQLSTDIENEYKTIAQKNTLELFTNWARRFVYDQYKKGSKYEQFASLLQNVTSAKYMIFNVTGGVANVLTGLTNILGETFARDYFDPKDFAEAQARYFASLPSTLSTMYSDESHDINSALYKLFEVVNYDAMLERRPGEELHEWADRFQGLLYGLQTGGEHYMQNLVLLATLMSHRLVKDSKGKYHLMNYSQYINDIEYRALREAIKDNTTLISRYNKEIVILQRDANKRMKYDELRNNFVTDFIKGYTLETNDNELLNKYLQIKKDMMRNAKSEFETNARAIDQYELKNGRAVIKEGSHFTEEMFANIKNKVIQINKEIHGVYDKIGAAKIEAEWWGSLVMQYHKHLYPGFMKRYRVKGYYNELKDSFEKGSYMSTLNFMLTEYKNINERVKKDKEEGENLIVASLLEFGKATIDTITNMKLNWEMLPEWEKNNIRKTYGDLCGIAASMLMAIGLHMATEDDDLKNSNTLSTILYLSDRLFSETRLYTPAGLLVETETLMSSPLAATSSVEDLLKAMNIIFNIAFDENYDPMYTTGLYRGEHRLMVLLKRNIPGYRVYNRLQNMSRNNQYYRINDNSRNIKVAKNIANLIVEEN